jgi:hypothetical protein
LSLLKTESELTFCCCRGLFFGVLVCCLCSMDEMLICFSLVFDRWMTTLTPPLEPMDGSVVTGCTAPGFLPCFGTCCTASATRIFPRTVAVRTVSTGWGAARSMWTFRLTPPTRPLVSGHGVQVRALALHRSAEDPLRRTTAAG